MKDVRWSVDGDLIWGVSLARGQLNKIGAGGNYVWCNFIVTIFMGLEGRGFKVIIWREAEEGGFLK